MGTFDVAYCVEADLRSILPSIADYDKKRPLLGWTEDSTDLYKLGSVGSISMLYKGSSELGTAQTTKVACDTEGEWFYDSSLDEIYYFTLTNPNGEDIEAGTDWSTLVTAVISKSSEMVRAIVGKQILKHAWGTRDYDEVIVSSTAAIACGRLVRPHNEDLANRLEFYYNYEGDEFPKGILQRVRDGQISLSSEITPALGAGILEESAVDASTTGGINDIRGIATGNDTIKIIIDAGATFSYGSASAVTYSVWIKDDTGLMTYQYISGETIDGDYQDLAYGLDIRFNPGKYVTSDAWYVKVSKEPVETHQGFDSLRLTKR